VKHKSDFSKDLITGHLGEQDYSKEVIDCMSGDIEIKSEQDTWKETGNMFVEFQSRGRDSGIATTQADHWVVSFYLKNKLCFTLSIPTITMKKIARKYYDLGRIANGGDNDTSKGVLVPISSVLYFNYDKEQT
jgi:hypothetical protein